MLARAGPRARPRRRRPQHRDGEVGSAARATCSRPRWCAGARACGRRPRVRSATSTRCATTRSRSRSARPAPARATSRSRSRCRRSRRRRCNRIILTRPAVEAGERLGFLPGDMLAKVDPYLRPLYDALYDMLDPESVARLMERGVIEVAPLAYMRGRTLNDSFIILDEAQNTTAEQMKMFLTRLGFGSKIVVTGDVTQIDLPDGRGRSGSARGSRHPRRRRRISRSSISAPATSCGTGSCRTSSTPTPSDERARECERRLDLRQRRAERRRRRRRSLGAPGPPRLDEEQVPGTSRVVPHLRRPADDHGAQREVPRRDRPDRRARVPDGRRPGAAAAASPTRAGGVPVRRPRPASRRPSSAMWWSVRRWPRRRRRTHGDGRRGRARAPRRPRRPASAQL